MQTEQLIERYLETWNETDADARRTAVADVYADGAQYVDPLADVTGHDQISELIGAVQQQVPGHVFRLADGAVLEEDGRIVSVIGFLDNAPGG